MPPFDYVFEDVTRQVDLSAGSTDRPIVVLLHGTGGTVSDMTTPGASPDSNYDFSSPLSPDVTIGRRVYPGIGVWSCCNLDPKKDVRSWRDILSMHAFPTVVYSQVDNRGFLERPTLELQAIMDALVAAHPNRRFVLLAQSRGGLLVRNFLKRFPKSALQVTNAITLHSPHTGSGLATAANDINNIINGLSDALGSAVRDAFTWLLDIVSAPAFQKMTVGSPFLTGLADGEQPLKWIEYHTFGGVSVRLSRIRSWVYTLGSAVPDWNWPPFTHERTEIEVPGISPIADSLPDLIDELTEGRGDLLTADARTRLPFATHQTNSLNHAESLWDPILQAQVLRILGVDVDIGTPRDEPAFWA